MALGVGGRRTKMFYASKVLSQIFANPPYYILRCVVASEIGSEPIVVKGNIAGPVSSGSVFTFSGKRKIDKNNKAVLEISRNPINPKYLKGTALTQWSEWSNPEMQSSVELMSDLVDSGIPVNIINSLWKDIKANPLLIKENPWSLVYKGVSFQSADAIAKTLMANDYSITNPHRVQACVFWSMAQGVQQGNCYLDSNTVFRDASLLTGITDPKKIAVCIKDMVESDPPKMVIDKTQGKKCLYLPAYFQMEDEVSAMVASPVRRKSEIEISDEEIKSYTRYNLTDTQVNAIRQGVTEPFSIVTGLPGTGKTTILSTICKILIDNQEDILLVAPTGIAAKRASILSGIKAVTIHRAFGAGQPSESDEQKSDYEGVKKDEETESLKPLVSKVNPRNEIWKYHTNNPRTESVLIIDESSMVDLHLMWRMLRGIAPKCRVIMVGDIAQLPPVGAGFVLSELIESDCVPRTHLVEVFRQGEGSGVTQAAHNVHNGVVPTSNDDFFFLEKESEQKTLETIIKLCRDFHLDDIDFHVISPTHHGLLGVTNLNKELRSVLNPDIGGMRMNLGKDTLREGDRVMVTKNEYDLGVYNGDVGRICGISKVSVDILIKGVQDQIVSIPRDQVSKILRLAYATTVHKSQGLEYELIIMPLVSSCSVNLLQRSLLYTAVTRAKDKVYLVGDTGALATCVYNEKRNHGFSGLSKRFKSME